MKYFVLSLIMAVSLAACTNYGKKVSSGNVEVYYKDGISEKEAQQTADLLYDGLKTSGGDLKDKKSIQLTRGMKDTINFRMVVNKEKLKQVKDVVFSRMANALSSAVFKDLPVNVELTNDKFETFHTIYYAAIESGDGSEAGKATAGNIEVYMKGGVTQEQADQLAVFLNNEVGEPDHTISFSFSKSEDGIYLVQMVSDRAKADDLTDHDLKLMANRISINVLESAALNFELTDETFTAFKSVGFDPNDQPANTVDQ